jgi:general transcription factor 3C polypeptide 5 (transcription factor C subunit 1)
MCNPILSRNIPTSNVLLKITVPKRTGRKRKRGSDAPFSGDYTASSVLDGRIKQSDTLRSQSRQDGPAKLMRTLKDNIGKYNVEAVATIEQTHRYRGKFLALV